MGFGDTEQVDALGAPEQLKFTVPEKPPAAEAVRSNVAAAPAATVADWVVVAMAKPVEPAPVSETVCGLSVAESVSVNVPVRVPLAVGVKVTATVQLALGDREAAQLFVSEKSPLVCTWLICNPKGPGLFQGHGLGRAGSAHLLARERQAVRSHGQGGSCSLAGQFHRPRTPGGMSVMVRVPVRVPVAVGVNVTWIAQVPPAGETVPQLF